jgi:uncharacterized protein YutE (UPF0331/DUF86 family)
MGIKMIDKDKINSKIIFIKERLLDLSALAKLSEEDFKSDKRNLASSCYWLQTSIESMIDIVQHIAVKEGLIKFGDITSADFFKVLAEKGIVSEKNLIKYIQMIKFRNRIVHIYQEVSEDEVIKIIKNNLNDFEEFLKEIVRHIRNR